MHCTKCGSPLPNNTRFCTKCGTPASAPAAQNICSGCGSSVPAGNKFCIKCGKPMAASPAQNICAGCGSSVPAGNKFCIKCGKPTAAPAAQPQTTAAPAVSGGKCPVCGAQTVPGDAFCDSCGANLREAAAAASAPPADPHKDYRKPDGGAPVPPVAPAGVEDDLSAAIGKPFGADAPPVNTYAQPQKPPQQPHQPQYQQPQQHSNNDGRRKSEAYPEPKPAKKSRKGLIIGIIIGLVLLLLGGLAAFVLTSPAFKTMKDLSACDFESAAQRYEEGIKDNGIQSKLFELFVGKQYKITLSDFTNGKLGYADSLEYVKTVVGFDAIDGSREKFAEAIKERCRILSDGYTAGTLDFNTVSAELNEIARYEKELLQTQTSTAEDQLKTIEEMERSRTAFMDGENAMTNSEYAAAIAAYSSVTANSPLYTDALAKLQEAKTAYKRSLLDDIDAKIAANDYDAAEALLSMANDAFPGDADISGRANAIQTAMVDRAIALSSEKQQAEDYLGALGILSEALQTLGEVPELRSEYTAFENRFVIHVQTQVNEKLATDWEGAKTLAEEALNALPSNTALASLLQNVLMAKPQNGGNSGGSGGGSGSGGSGGISLTSINWYDSYRAEVGGYVDASGRRYPDCLRLDDRWNETVYAYYNINRAYSRFEAVITPDAGGREWREVHLKILGNNTVLYEADIIHTSQPQQISINISGYEQLKFELSGDNNNTGVDVLIAAPTLVQ